MDVAAVLVIESTNKKTMSTTAEMISQIEKCLEDTGMLPPLMRLFGKETIPEIKRKLRESVESQQEVEVKYNWALDYVQLAREIRNPESLVGFFLILAFQEETEQVFAPGSEIKTHFSYKIVESLRANMKKPDSTKLKAIKKLIDSELREAEDRERSMFSRGLGAVGSGMGAVTSGVANLAINTASGISNALSSAGQVDRKPVLLKQEDDKVPLSPYSTIVDGIEGIEAGTSFVYDLKRTNEMSRILKSEADLSKFSSEQMPRDNEGRPIPFVGPNEDPDEAGVVSRVKSVWIRNPVFSATEKNEFLKKQKDKNSKSKIDYVGRKPDGVKGAVFTLDKDGKLMVKSLSYLRKTFISGFNLNSEGGVEISKDDKVVFSAKEVIF
jgi:hypothetical protein